MSKVIKAGKSLDMSVKRLLLPEPDKEGRDAEGVAVAHFSALWDFVEDDGAENAPSSPGAIQPKQTSSSGEMADPISLAKQEAESILKKARQEANILVRRAKEMVEHSRQEAELLESKAYEQGFEQGKKDGEELGRRQLEVTAQRLNKLMEAIEGQGRTFFQKYEVQLIKLAMEAASQIVLRQIELDPTIVVDAVKSAFEKVIEGSHVRIRLHPKDVELVSEYLTRDQNISGSHPLDIIPDPSISQGGCLIETEFGLVDATVETRMESVRQEISKVLKERTGISL